jgi:hypothetical protein
MPSSNPRKRVLRCISCPLLFSSNYSRARIVFSVGFFFVLWLAFPFYFFGGGSEIILFVIFMPSHSTVISISKPFPRYFISYLAIFICFVSSVWHLYDITIICSSVPGTGGGGGGSPPLAYWLTADITVHNVWVKRFFHPLSISYPFFGRHLKIAFTFIHSVSMVVSV